MQFQVPQFIEVEDKIFGPLTIKQFIYLIGGGGLGYLSYVYLPSYIAPFTVIGFGALGVALAFVKINNKPFIYIVESFFRFTSGTRLYIWKKEEKKRKTQETKSSQTTSFVPGISESKLKDLAWSLDIHDRQATQDLLNEPPKNISEEA